MTKKLTYREAVRECKRLWKAIERSGVSKNDFLFRGEKGRFWLQKRYEFCCPLCDYTGHSCFVCPLVLQYNKPCSELDYSPSSVVAGSRFFLAIVGLSESKPKRERKRR